MTIAGQILGIIGGTDHYGIIGENIGALKVGGTAMALAVGNSNDDYYCGLTNDLKVNEI